MNPSSPYPCWRSVSAVPAEVTNQDEVAELVATAATAFGALIETVAREAGGSGIRANSIVTRRQHDATPGPPPLFELVSPTGVANLALFLASVEGRTITGESIVVDAGAYLLG